VAAAVGVPFILFLDARARWERAAWEDYARSRGYRVETPGGRWWDWIGFGFSGTVGGAAFRLDHHVVHLNYRGRARTWTRIRAPLACPVPARLLIQPRDPGARLAGWLMRDRVPIADPALDGALVARCRNAAFASVLVATPALRRLADLPPNTSVRLDHDRVTVAKAGLVLDAAVLDCMLAIVGDITAILGPRPIPTS
jgi:hypothetical protein